MTTEKKDMEAMVVMAAIDGALTLIEKTSPLIAEMFKKGEITLEAQQMLKDRIAKLRVPEAFTGPEWEVRPDPSV